MLAQQYQQYVVPMLEAKLKEVSGMLMNEFSTFFYY
jgi:hypothetical protein